LREEKNIDVNSIVVKTWECEREVPGVRLAIRGGLGVGPKQAKLKGD